jgi:hypothetical protein
MPISKESCGLGIAMSGIREAFVVHQKNHVRADAQWKVTITLF